MEKKHELSIFINQKPVLSQALKYSLQILQMSNIDLVNQVEIEAAKNPFLMVEKNHTTCGINFLENTPASQSVDEKILEECCFFHFDDFQKEVLHHLLHSLDFSSYISSDLLKEISQSKNICYASILEIINKLKNTSIGHAFSFNLQDKLKTIMQNNNTFDCDYLNTIANIDCISSGDFLSIQKKHNINDVKMSQILQNIKTALKHSVHIEEASHIESADLIIEKAAINLETHINDEYIPLVSIDEELYRETTSRKLSARDLEYCKTNMYDAKLLIKSIVYRSRTLIRIMNQIVNYQFDFFIGKQANLSPLSIKSISNALSLHQSTIARAIANKSVSSPRGIFTLKSLLSKEVRSTTSLGLVSVHSIKEQIKQLVQHESPNNPYTDKEIEEFFAIRRINISRRTIAKYRRDLNICSSINREHTNKNIYA